MAPDTLPSKALQGQIYPRQRITDFTLDDNDLARKCPLDHGRVPLEPVYDLGMFDQLPLEILTDVLVQTDFRSLVDFRRLNKRAMQVVESLRSFRTVMEYSPDSLRGVLAIGTGSRISCQDLFATLGEARCAHCNDFAGYISLLSCTRVCFLCFSQDSKYLPLLESEAIRNFGLERRLIPTLDRVRSVSGCYSPNERICRDRLLLIDPESARRAGIALHGSVPAMERHVAQIARQKMTQYHEKIAQRTASGNQRRVPHPPSIPHGESSHPTAYPRRFMVIVRAPWIDLSSKSKEWGFHCEGCRAHTYRAPLHWRRKYCPETFAEHVLQCGPLKSERYGQPLEHDTTVVGYQRG